MALWHTSTELQLTTAPVVAKAVYTAGRLEAGLGLALGTAGAQSAELDTSG